MKKECKYCGDFFPTTTEYWYKNKKYKDGLDNRCKECKREYQRKWNKKNYEIKPLKEYALYKGERILYTGTIKEIAEQQGVKEQTIRQYGTPKYRKRNKDPQKTRLLICLD